MELIKLKVRESAAKGGHSKLIVDSFIESCVKLDTKFILPLLDEEKLFEEKNKWAFLAFLKGQFDFARSKGFERTIVRQGRCEMCVIGHSTYDFFGDDGKIRFAYIIEQKDGEIKDIYNCNVSSGWLRK